MRPIHPIRLWPIWTAFFSLDLVHASTRYFPEELPAQKNIVEVPYSQFWLGFDGPWHAIVLQSMYSVSGNFYMLPSFLDTNIVYDDRSCRPAFVDCAILPYSRDFVSWAITKDPSIDGDSYEIEDFIEKPYGQKQFVGRAVDTWQGYATTIERWNYTTPDMEYPEKWLTVYMETLLTVSRGIRLPPPFGNNESLEWGFVSNTTVLLIARIY